jgi:hypothetical protein
VSTLTDIIAAEVGHETFPSARAFATELKQHYGAATAAVIFYGSCLRQNTDTGLLDFYVLVDNYASALQNNVSAAFAQVLPPNIYFHEMTFEDRTLRAKVAIISVDSFLHGLGPKTFASSLWARFAQPSAILYARSEWLHRRLVEGLAEAVTTLLARVKPLLPDGFRARDLWIQAFKETYAAELRPERSSRCVDLVDADLARYAAVTVAVLGAPAADGAYRHAISLAERHTATRDWRLRRIQGKALNGLRLIKAAFTFQGGLDYALWKIARHSGVKLELGARRHLSKRSGAAD